MTIDEAMQDLSIQLEVKRRTEQFRSADAIKLGIEALKRVRGNRLYPQPTVYPLLPGETEEVRSWLTETIFINPETH